MNDIIKLKLFIEAAEMVGGAGWAPSQEQWTMLRAKIMELPDEAEVAAPLPPRDQFMPHPGYAPAPPMPEAPMPGLFDGGGQQQAPRPMVPMVPMPQDPSMGGSASTDIPIKLKINPDGSPAESFS